jgi:hypothetical protein
LSAATVARIRANIAAVRRGGFCGFRLRPRSGGRRQQDQPVQPHLDRFTFLCRSRDLDGDGMFARCRELN